MATATLSILLVATFYGSAIPVTVAVPVRAIPYETIQQCRDAVPLAKEIFYKEVVDLANDHGFAAGLLSLAWRCDAGVVEVRA